MTGILETEQGINNKQTNLNQPEIDRILEGFSFKENLEKIKTKYWKKGGIREILREKDDGTKLRTGLELFAEIPMIMVKVERKDQDCKRKLGIMDGFDVVEPKELYFVGKAKRIYTPVRGNIETGLSIEVVADTADTDLLVTDGPLIKNVQLVMPHPRQNYPGDTYFPFFEENDSSNLRKVTVSLNNKTLASEELSGILDTYTGSRRKRNNLPLQMQKIAERFMANTHYDKKPEEIDNMQEQFAKWRSHPYKY